MRTDTGNNPSNLQVTVKLQPTVRQIQRSPRKLAAVTMPTVRQGTIPRIARALAVAIDFQQMLERGEVRTYADLARLAAVSKERISQLMMLNWLAPDIQDAVLRLPPTFGGRFAISETTLRRVAKQPEWGAQREMWDRLTDRGGGEERKSPDNPPRGGSARREPPHTPAGSSRNFGNSRPHERRHQWTAADGSPGAER